MSRRLRDVLSGQEAYRLRLLQRQLDGLRAAPQPCEVPGWLHQPYRDAKAKFPKARIGDVAAEFDGRTGRWLRGQLPTGLRWSAVQRHMRDCQR